MQGGVVYYFAFSFRVFICLLFFLFFQSLLLKIDESIGPFCNAEVQTDEVSDCSLCKCQESLITPIKSPSMEDTKVELESGSQGKTYEPPELVQLLSSSPLIHLKQEITCVPDPVSSSSAQCPGVEMTISDIDIKELKTKSTLKLHENSDCSSSQIGKCVLTSPLSVGTPLEHMELDYVTSAHLDEDGTGEILLHDLVSHFCTYEQSCLLRKSSSHVA